MTLFENIKELIEENDIISFDVYDTLVKRIFDCPKDVYDAVERVYNIRYNRQLKGYKKIRVDAEGKARKYSSKQDITFDDIYSYIDYHEKENLKEIELEIEECCIVPNQEMIDIFNYCKSIGKKVIITTDMYLPRFKIISILNKCNIFEYDKLYISGEVGLTKLKGDLFNYISSDLKSNSILHIGDNIINDYKKPKEKGIAAYYYRIDQRVEKIYYKPFKKRYEIKYLSNFISLSNHYNREKLYEFGYSMLGPIVYEYCIWLHSEIVKNNISKLIFLSREGYFLKRVYEYLYPDENGLYYFGFNNNSLFYPLLYIDSSISSFFNNIPMKKDIYSARYLFEILVSKAGFTSEWVNEIISRYEISDKSLDENSWKEDKKFISAYEFIISEIKPLLKKQYDFLIEYINENIADAKDLLLVNNSMAGSAQRKLKLIFKHADIYSNIWSVHFIRSKKLESMNLKHFTFFDKSCNEVDKSFFDSVCILFEMLLFPCSGTSILYGKNQSGIYTIYEEDNYAKHNFKYISTVQEGALDFVKNYNKCSIYKLEHSNLLKVWCRFLKYPEPEDVKLFVDFIDYEDNSLKKIISKINKIDVEALRKVWWKQGTLAYNDKKLPLYLYNIKNTLIYLRNKRWE